MNLVEKLKSLLIDTGLLVGLMLAVAVVYSVETRLPRTHVDKPKEGYEEKVEIETGLSGTTEHRTYVLRTRKDKAKWIAQFGGSVADRGLRAGRPELAGPPPGRRRLLVECMSRPESRATRSRSASRREGMHRPRPAVRHVTDRVSPCWLCRPPGTMNPTRRNTRARSGAGSTG